MTVGFVDVYNIHIAHSIVLGEKGSHVVNEMTR